MEKSDHIALTLSAAEVNLDPVPIISSKGPQRKSLRRTWNQLPRLQRNLILLGIFVMCLILLLILPSESDDDKVTAALRENSYNFEDSASSEYLKSNLNDKESKHKLKSKFKEVPLSLMEHNVIDEKEKIKSQLPKLKSLPIKKHLPKTQLPNYDSKDYAESNNKNVNLEPSYIQKKHDIEKTAALAPPDLNTELDQRTLLEEAARDPFKLPGRNPTISIDDYLKSLAQTQDAQKQHFHGANNERQIAVVAAFKHSWTGYKKYAWGHDNLKPLSQSSYDWFDLGLTIVDSLTTMYIMGLEDEFQEATNWVDEHLNFDTSRDVNLFEVTIRVLGGLLSSYHLSGDKVFLKKSIELGNRLLPCFLSHSGIPYSDVNLASLSAHSPKWSPDSSTSEVTTIQLEFRDLSRSINVPIYEDVVQAVNEKVHALEKNNGLVPIFINANTGTFRNYATISLGARGDSYYEYLLKQWIQTGRKENDFLIMDYMHAVDGILTQLMRRTPKEQHVYVGELINGKDFKPKMDHLTCYLPGTLILGHKFGMPDSHLLLAKDLLETCYQTYMRQPTHLAPEISYFAVNEDEENDIYVKPNDAHNLLRPEFVESLYYFYVITGNRTYQDMGWNIFQAFEKHTKVANGYTSIGNVKNVFNTRLRDMMESFWLGETLKYFYLLFSDNRKEIDLDKWVFNTEAHPLPNRSS